jgi:hypothetical protein
LLDPNFLKDPVERLEKLTILLQRGLISQEQFNAAQQRVLNELAPQAPQDMELKELLTGMKRKFEDQEAEMKALFKSNEALRQEVQALAHASKRQRIEGPSEAQNSSTASETTQPSTNVTEWTTINLSSASSDMPMPVGRIYRVPSPGVSWLHPPSPPVPATTTAAQPQPPQQPLQPQLLGHSSTTGLPRLVSGSWVHPPSPDVTLHPQPPQQQPQPHPQQPTPAQPQQLPSPQQWSPNTLALILDADISLQDYLKTPSPDVNL